MAFGDDIGGFKYVNPKKTGNQEASNTFDELFIQKQDYSGSSLDNSWTRRITGVTRVGTQAELHRLSKVLEKCLPEGIDENSIPGKWKELRVKLEELFLENRDLGKSIDRGKRDVSNFKKPGTEFIKKIYSELVHPLRAYIRFEPSVPAEKKEYLEDRVVSISVDLLRSVSNATRNSLLEGNKSQQADNEKNGYNR